MIYSLFSKVELKTKFKRRFTAVANFFKGLIPTSGRFVTNDLTAKGINKDNITHSTVCTFDDEKCHSFRRDGVNSGRMQSIMIKI